MCLLLLLQLNQSIFTPSDTLYALNANILYVTSNFEESDSKELGTISLSPEVIMPFDQVQLKGKNYRMNTVPFIENKNELPITGEIPSGNNVLINQNVADILSEAYNCSRDKLLQQTIQIPYTVSQTKYPLIFTITGIVEEQDVGSIYQIYYDKDDVFAIVQQQNPEIYDLMMRMPTKFMTTLEDKNMTIEKYEKQQDKLSLYTIYNPIIETRQATQNEMGIFRTIFQFLFVLVYLVALFYILYDIHKEWKKQLANFALINACQVKLKYIRFTYLAVKGKAFFISFVFLLLELLVYLYGCKPSMDQLYWNVMLIASIYILLFSILLIYVVSLKETHLATYLKDDKDQK